jgi:hypothetical protein
LYHDQHSRHGSIEHQITDADQEPRGLGAGTPSGRRGQRDAAERSQEMTEPIEPQFCPFCGRFNLCVMGAGAVVCGTCDRLVGFLPEPQGDDSSVGDAKVHAAPTPPPVDSQRLTWAREKRRTLGPSRRCQHCGCGDFQVQRLRRGPHYARANCAHCGRYVCFLPKPGKVRPKR